MRYYWHIPATDCKKKTMKSMMPARVMTKIPIGNPMQKQTHFSNLL